MPEYKFDHIQTKTVLLSSTNIVMPAIYCHPVSFNKNNNNNGKRKLSPKVK